MSGNTLIRTEAIWTNEPADWRAEGDRLTARARPRTDFWRKTRNGFIADNGHLYGAQVRGDFVVRVHVAGEFRELYDQAGLMVMLDPAVWLKAGIEYIEGRCYLSTVVTHDYSDWAVARPLESPSVWLTIERDREALIVSASLDGQDYFLLRECRFTDELTLEVGPYLCAPAGDGFTATFDGFEIRQPRLPRRAHALD